MIVEEDELLVSVELMVDTNIVLVEDVVSKVEDDDVNDVVEEVVVEKQERVSKFLAH